MIDRDETKIGMLPATVVLAVALAASHAAADDAAKVPSGTLRYHFQKGDKYVILISAVDAMKMERVAEGTANSRVRQTESAETWEVVGVSARGDAELEAWSRDKQVLVTADGHPQRAFNRSQPQRSDPGFFLMDRVISKYPRRLTITNQGEVSKVTGLEEAIDEFRGELEKRTDDRQVRAMWDMTIEDIYGEENVRKLAADILVPYPAQPVRKGDTWDSSLDYSFEFARMAVKQQFTLDSDSSGDQARRVSAKGKATFTPKSRNVDVDFTRAETTVQVSLDPRTGFPLRGVERLDFDMTSYAKADGQRKPVIRVISRSRTRFSVIRWETTLLLRKSEVLGEKGRLTEAIEELDKAIAVQPDCAVLYHNRGVARQDAKDHQGAIKDFDKALQVDPEYEDSYHARAFSRFQTKDLDGAVKDYTEVIQRKPDTWEHYYLRGWMRMEQRKYDQAIPDLTAAIERNLDNPNIYRMRATAHLQAGDKAAAEADMATFRKLSAAAT